MKKGLVITILSCVALFIIGTLVLLIGIAKGGKVLFNIDYGNHKITTTRNAELSRGTVSVEEFSGMNIELPNGDFRIVEGDEYKVSYAVYCEEAPTIDVLKFSVKSKDNYFSFNLSNEKEEVTPYVEVTVPTGTILKESEVDIAYGDSKIDGLTLEDATFNLADGDIKFNNIKIDSLEIKSALGDINISDSDIGETDIEASAGNITLTDTRFSKLDINAAYGDVDLDVAGEEADYSLDVDLSFGKFELNGKEKKNRYSQNSDKDKKIDVDIATGDLSISFK